MQSLHFAPDCGPDQQNHTQAIGWVKDPTGVIWYFDPHGILTSGSIFIHGILTPLIENCMVNWTPMVVWTPYPWYNESPNHGILTPLHMEYRTLYPWYIDPTIHSILTPYPWYFDPLPMAYWTPYPWYIKPRYPWYFDHPTHSISNPLSMVYWAP